MFRSCNATRLLRRLARFFPIPATDKVIDDMTKCDGYWRPKRCADSIEHRLEISQSDSVA